MKLVHKDFDFVFDFKENKQGLLVVESPCLFCKFVEELLISDDSKFVLSENNSVIEAKKNLTCLVDFFNVNLNERKILTKLNELIKNEVLNSELMLEGNELCAKIEILADKISNDMDFVLEYNKDIDLSNLIKFMDFKLVQEQGNLLEHLMDYIKIYSEILKIKLFVFVNFMSYFDEYQTEKLIEFANYQKLNLLFVENKMPENLKIFQIAYVLDKDCCQISLNDV